MVLYGEDIDLNREYRKPFGFKADRIHRSVLIDSSTARPGGNINVLISKIKDELIIPGSMYISFKCKPTSTTDKSAYFVPNLGRAIVKGKELLFNGKRAMEYVEYGEYKLYRDLWLTKGERKERILQGIQDVTSLKYRIGAKKDAAGAALTGVSDNAKAIKTVYENLFYIPLDDELFTDVTPFSPIGLNDNVTIRLEFAEARDVVKSSDQDASYEIQDMHLEWDSIIDRGLTSEIESMYQSGFGVLYDRVQLLRKEPHNKSESLINVNIRESLRSLRGVMILFKDTTADQGKYATNRETFYFPKIEKIEVSINGKSNQLYPNGITSKDLWYEARKLFQGSTNMTQGDFYKDKFCIWVDTRSSIDQTLHGNGMRLDGSNSGLNLAITKTSEASGNMMMYIFLIVDSVIEFSGNSYKKVCYALDDCSTGDGNE